ncbi:GntR family transcriptional regulator [Enterococcus asini]|uniref:GntR family transcriptional regulator n=1 Tax=Enterococcus asini TaxID=57732 RepID=UPI0028917CCC|nr:GntR family transcriptional regulator [Enterococcus asini]MDT2756532.1 GntR family transcriptional regulator [Enterococcus asini]
MSSTSLQSQAFKAIREKIIYSDLEPGRKISEKGLEDLLKIGRTPIREALIQLRAQALVYTIPQSGTYVSKIDLVAAQNARFVREQLEKQIMMECCAKLTFAGEESLKEIIRQQEIAVQQKDERGFFKADNYFHEICFDIAQRKEIWNWLNDHNTHLERFRWLRVNVEGLRWDTIMEQHYQLFEALTARNTEEVSFLTSLHLHMMLNEQEIVLEKYPDYWLHTEE